jgi:flagellar FliL protein
MATQAIEQVPATAEDSADAIPASSGKRGVILLALAGLLAGGGAGMFGVGPVIAKKLAAAAVAGAAKPKGAEAKGPVVAHTIDNLVLNPAGTEGTRFLMVSATFRLRDGNADQLMKEREPEVRDEMLRILGHKTIQELTDMSAREAIRKEVIDGVAHLFPPGSIERVFFPQFVVQ